jgi:hypothetical protein
VLGDLAATPWGRDHGEPGRFHLSHRSRIFVLQARTYPLETADVDKTPRLSESTLPEIMRTMHFPQVPLPPQGDSISNSAFRMASRSSMPDGTSMVFPEGLKVINGMAYSCILGSGFVGLQL